MIYSLANIFTPTHAISLDCALQTVFDSKNVTCTLLITLPGLDDIKSEMTNVIKKMLANSPVNYQIRSQEELMRCTDAFDSFLYPHDVVGDSVQTLAERFPTAQRICIGDGLGMVCDREFHVGLVVKGRSRIGWKTRKDWLIRNLRLAFNRRTIRTGRSIVPDRACLILPVDQTGWSLSRVPIQIPEKALVRLVLSRMEKQFPDISKFAAEIGTHGSANRPALILTENLSEGLFISLDREIEMYGDLIRSQCTKDQLVIVKSHPGDRHSRIDLLRKALPNYNLIGPPETIKRVPFELWDKVISMCNLIALSYPSLSIPYLYDQPVFNPVTDHFIEKWFEPRLWDSFKNAHKMYLVPAKNLKTWDKKKVLGRGPF